MNISNKGQTMVEALFAVVFMTIVMFAFLQICIIVVDDMTANEAAFVAMRSAAVTKKNKREEEVQSRVKKYLEVFYQPLLSLPGRLNQPLMSGSFKFSDAETVGEYYVNNNPKGNENITVVDVNRDQRVDDTGKPYEDYSGNKIMAQTTSIYYFTRVMFGSLVAKRTSNINDIFTIAVDRTFGISGNRRYQSARNRMVPSPDENYYHKAYPGAEKFDE